METLSYRADAELHGALLKHKDREPETKDSESNYVDLDLKPDGPTVRVTFTGDRDQLSVSSRTGDRNPASHEDKEDTVLPELPDPDSEKRTELDSGDELRYTDMCLNSKAASDDGTTVWARWDTAEDESHYITTHEIQLTELDHDVDYDLGRGTRWDFEDGNLVYSFVDYASFDSGDPQGGEEEEEEGGTPTPEEVRANLGRAAVSTEQEDSDLYSSDESLCRNQNRNPAGEIHLSIQTSPGAGTEAQGTCWHTHQLTDSSHLVSSGSRGGPLVDRAPYFIPAPGRQHRASKLRRRDINEYSSGASSSFSELDDADKEVRNLTARSFRSLACPYFDAINLSTSSESSAPDCGLNKWSAYVDWSYDRELEMSRAAAGGDGDARSRASRRVSSRQAAPSGPKGQMREQRGVTLSFRCTGAKCAQNVRPDQATSDGAGDTHKRAIFASSLLKNVISKKMQFEHERKMERGEICDSHPSGSPCPNTKDLEKSLSAGLQRQTSGSADDQNPEGGRSSSCTEETKDPETVLGGALDPPEAEPDLSKGSDSSSVLTKLLFVPSCQLLSSTDRNCTDTTRDAAAPARGKDTMKVEEGHEKGGKTPEIKIRLTNENRGCTLNIANLLTPKISYDVHKFRAAEDSRCPVVSAAEKVPNFSVRDIRDTRCRLQAPIYHVRDVRKLVKSSYRFVSLNRSGSKNCTALGKLEEKAQVEPAPPMVIKCNSVKTKASEVDAPSEPSQSENTPSLRVSSRTKQANPDQAELQTHLEVKPAKQRSDKRSNDVTAPKQEALEKIKAAVKTMEQLYVFDRNEWRRKSQSSRPVTDVMSLPSRDEQASPQATETGKTHEEKRAPDIIHVPYNRDTFKTHTPPSFTNKSVLHCSDDRHHGDVKPDRDPPSSTASAAPLSVKAEPEKTQTSCSSKVAQVCSDSENYLTIPGLGASNEPKLLVPSEQTEYPAATFYHHHPTGATSPHKQQVVYFSPSVPNASPTPSTGDKVPQIQRKMLLDPSTGRYYLVDTPIQATTKRLFDPETGRYVDVPMPQSPVTPITPVPLPLSPLALSPGAYTPTYMIYPGFIPSPTLAAQAVTPQSPCRLEDVAAATAGDNVKLTSHAPEKAYYSATDGAPQGGPLHLPASLGHVTSRGGGASCGRKSLISITTQQGPRIIAPPSFDGKTMSFIVEHR
ncbi:uncharacterized protein C4orf54 homolog [Nematolebias whitei]|uniref:uncharacterized protein C4orf54 homolog n=1 Tax=Nematolebias whitei TaxID=451745 RepID=UPI001897F336|nr:uncharacterized protein C4orf54 homolog [Nematolebias whitei]